MSAAWRVARAEAAEELAAAGVANAEQEARFIVEEVSGYGAPDWLTIADGAPSERAAARLRALVRRRAAGEPLQYVLGSWSFRGLDLMVDRRVLIPRPETEQVVEVALEEAERRGLRRVRHRRPSVVPDEPSVAVADLGTGSGAIALALDAELADVTVWATDVSEDALAVARANIAGCAAARVRVAAGAWFDALPRDLHGRLALVVSNPPYVAAGELATLPAEVADYEPVGALVAGPTGREALEHIVDTAREWLEPAGVLVCELAPHQASDLVARARSAGYDESFVRADLAGRARVLVARAG